MQGFALPPHDARPRAFSDEFVFVEDDGFANRELGPKSAGCLEVRTLDRRRGARVAGRRRENNVGERLRRVSDPQCQRGCATVVNHLNARKPPTCPRQGGESRQHERVDIDFGK